MAEPETSESTESPEATGSPDARGEATREALLEAGLELFGRLGYHAASNRALAESAGVNQALIGYHFGGKRGLYLAVFERIAGGLAARLGPVVRELEARLADEGAHRAARLEALTRVVDRLVELFAAPETGAWAMLIVREQQHPGEAFDLLWKRAISVVLDALTRALETLSDPPAARGEARLLAITLVGQALVFRVARAAALRHLGWEDFGPTELDSIQRRIHRNVHSWLSGEDRS